MTHILRSSGSAQLPSAQDEWVEAGLGNRICRFGISKVAMDMEGLVTCVLWERLSQVGNQGAAREAVVSVKVVVAAIRDGHSVFAIFPGMATGLPERRFLVEERGRKGATVVLEGPPTPGRNLHDLYMLFLEGVGASASTSLFRTH